MFNGGMIDLMQMRALFSLTVGEGRTNRQQLESTDIYFYFGGGGLMY
jgi:hypothetical protein